MLRAAARRRVRNLRVIRRRGVARARWARFGELRADCCIQSPNQLRLVPSLPSPPFCSIPLLASLALRRCRDWSESRATRGPRAQPRPTNTQPTTLTTTPLTPQFWRKQATQRNTHTTARLAPNFGDATPGSHTAQHSQRRTSHPTLATQPRASHTAQHSQRRTFPPTLAATSSTLVET